MLLVAALLLAQDVPAAAPSPDETDGEEIVVQAKLGRTTMLFDKGADGKLRNCRIMVSSGSQKRDTDACQATPVCYAKTVDIVTECRELGMLELADTRAPGPLAPAGATPVFTLPTLVGARPPALVAGQAGPLGAAEESRDTERQRVKLPPLPKPPSDGPVIRFGTQQESDQ